MDDISPIKDVISPAQPEKSGIQCFQDTCLNWPHNQTPMLGATGDECCWQWVNS